MAAIEGPTLSHWQRKIELQKWAVLGGRFGLLATRYWVSAGYVPRFTPPEGSFVNFLAQVTNTFLRYRGGKSGATAQPARCSVASADIGALTGAARLLAPDAAAAYQQQPCRTSTGT